MVFDLRSPILGLVETVRTFLTSFHSYYELFWQFGLTVRLEFERGTSIPGFGAQELGVGIVPFDSQLRGTY